MSHPSRFVVPALWLCSLAALQAKPEWEPDIYPDNQIFPSQIISSAMLELPEEMRNNWVDPHLGEDESNIGAAIEDLPKGAEVTVTVKPNRFIEGGSITVRIPKSGDWLIHPKIVYDFEALAKIRQPRPANITMSVSVDGVPLGDKTETVTVRSINDCLFAVDEGEDNQTDYSYLFAAYVNEDHPWVDGILRDALESGIVDSFDGYQSEDPDKVVAQIYAIWDTMKKRKVRYSDITTTASESDTVFSQHVRLFDDAIRARQANCVDGSVLFAAVLRKIGLSPSLVGVPGHMYLAVALDPEGDDYIGIETTMIGATEASRSSPADWVSNEARKKWKDSLSWCVFEEAVNAGTEDLSDNAKKFLDETEMQYQLIDIATARSFGIMPIMSGDEKDER